MSRCVSHARGVCVLPVSQLNRVVHRILSCPCAKRFLCARTLVRFGPVMLMRNTKQLPYSVEEDIFSSPDQNEGMNWCLKRFPRTNVLLMCAELQNAEYVGVPKAVFFECL